MADEFTTLCVNSLKARMEEYRKYTWYTEQSLNDINNARMSIDIYGEAPESRIIVEFEMCRRRPDNNAYKLLNLGTGKKQLILHIFSPFYEVNPHYKWANFCEKVLPAEFKKANVTYATYRWNLDKLPIVRKACQVLPNSRKEFPPVKDIEDAITTLAKDLKAIISRWETGETP